MQGSITHTTAARQNINLQWSARKEEKQTRRTKESSALIRNVVYGIKDEKSGFGQFVEVFMFEEDGHLGINWTNNGQVTVFHFLIRDKDDYEE